MSLDEHPGSGQLQPGLEHGTVKESTVEKETPRSPTERTQELYNLGGWERRSYILGRQEGGR